MGALTEGNMGESPSSEELRDTIHASMGGSHRPLRCRPCGSTRAVSRKRSCRRRRGRARGRCLLREQPAGEGNEAEVSDRGDERLEEIGGHTLRGREPCGVTTSEWERMEGTKHTKEREGGAN